MHPIPDMSDNYISISFLRTESRGQLEKERGDYKARIFNELQIETYHFGLRHIVKSKFYTLPSYSVVFDPSKGHDIQAKISGIIYNHATHLQPFHAWKESLRFCAKMAARDPYFTL